MQDLTTLTESQTVLLPNDTLMQEAFSKLAQQYNITSPETFLDRLISVGDINYEPPSFMGGTDIDASSQEAAGVVLYGFANMHVLRGAYNFYSQSGNVGPAVRSYILNQHNMQG